MYSALAPALLKESFSDVNKQQQNKGGRILNRLQPFVQ